VLTRANGMYLVQGLEVGGPYTVTVRGIGYGDFVREDVYVRLSQSTRVDAQLSVQAVQLEALDITVRARRTSAPTRQGVVHADLRHARLARADVQPRLRRPAEAVAAGRGQRRPAGAYNRFNTITLDGANQSERFNLASTGGVPGGSAGGKIVSMDAIKEFSVIALAERRAPGQLRGHARQRRQQERHERVQGGGIFTYRSNEDVLGFNLVGEDRASSSR
jgi:hypothetical protein